MCDNENNFQMNKINVCEYKIQFYLENKNIYLHNIIDFGLVKLFYDLNQDIYEKIDLNILSDTEATLLAINKHLFQDLGISQKYTYLKIKKTIIQDEKKIIFDSKSQRPEEISSLQKQLIPEKAKQSPIEEFLVVCNIINQHKIELNIDLKLDMTLVELPNFVENLLRKIFLKMFKRVKQFIENIE